MKIIGHRGARGLAPENTLTSFKTALKHHVDMLEFDLRVSKDSVVVVNHDPHLTLPSGTRIQISTHTYAELLQYKPDLATFQEVLTVVGHKVPLYVEVKPGEPIEEIVGVLKKCLANGWKPEHFRLASFSQKTLLELQTALPVIQKIVIEKWSGVRAGRRARQLNTKVVCMNQKWLWWGFIRSVNKSGWDLYTYTLNDPTKAKKWAKYGLKGVVTDYPDRFEE